MLFFLIRDCYKSLQTHFKLKPYSMHIFKDTRDLPYSKEQIASLVLNVNAYKNFLPWIVESHILEQDQNYFTAYLAFSYSGIKKGYTSRTIINQTDTVIEIKTIAIDGPFKSLKSIWEIEEISSSASRINYSIEISFSNPLYSALFLNLFEDMVIKTMNAFKNRADDLFQS
ncbi:MAG: Persistence and stress-resistance toxin PasT [Holosporales bacterium]